MEIQYDNPSPFFRWSPDIPCVITRQDPIGGHTETIGMCLTSGEPEAKTIACWRAEKGWTFEDFAETPIDRMKGWLELCEKLLRSAANSDSDDYCEAIRYWRAASDGLAVIDRIANENAVSWDASLGKLYDAIKTKVREISAQFEDQSKTADGIYVAYTILKQRKEEANNLADAANLTHSLITPGEGRVISTPPGIDLASLSRIASAIYTGLKFIGGVTFAKAIAIVLAVVVTIYVVVRIFHEIINIVKSWF